MAIHLRTCAVCLGIAAAPTASFADGWFWQNPFPQGNDLNAVAAIDANTMVAVGNLGAVVKTTDGGRTWSTQHHAGGTANDLDGGETWAHQLSGTPYELNAIVLIDANTGTAVGRLGTILRTQDGGDAWMPQVSPTTLHIYGVAFVNADIGAAVGDLGLILRTTDGG